MCMTFNHGCWTRPSPCRCPKVHEGPWPPLNGETTWVVTSPQEARWVDRAALGRLLGPGVDPADARLLEDAAAAERYCERVRWDLRFPDSGLIPDIQKAGQLYAARLWLQRTAPVGMPAYDELGNPQDLGASLATVHQLLGQPRPVVA